MLDEECDKLIDKYKRWYLKGKITLDEYIEYVNSVQYGMDLFEETE